MATTDDQVTDSNAHQRANDDGDDGQVRIAENEQSFANSLPDNLAYQRRIPRAQAIDIFKRFDWSMDKLIDHLYITRE